MESDYSFLDYEQDIAETRTGEHLTTGYALLGLIGELGELVENYLMDNVDLFDENVEVFSKLYQFAVLATQIEIMKKDIRDKQIKVMDIPKPENKDAITEELGGILWYLNTIAGLSGVQLDRVAEANRDLLKRRFNHNPGWMTNGGEKLH